MKTQSIFHSVRMLQSILFLIFLTSLTNIQAQPPLKARPLNVFTSPGQAIEIDVASKSELGNCNASSIGVTLSFSITSVHGSASMSGRNIVYSPNSGFVGQDSLHYQITCSGNISEAVILINVGDKPEVIIDNACAVPPVPMVWQMQETANLGEVSTYCPALVGDMDGDGKPEIVSVYLQNLYGTLPSGMSTTGHTAQRLVIIRGEDKSRLEFLTQQPFHCYHPGIFAIVKTKIKDESQVEKDSAIIVIAEGDRKLRAYDVNGQFVWESSEVYTDYTHRYISATVNFADFNNDGYAEVYTGNRIYDAATGKLLCRGNGNSGYGSFERSEGVFGIPSHMTVAADVYGDERLELVAGAQIYQVKPDLSSMTVVRELDDNLLVNVEDASLTMLKEGYTQVADIDGDGFLDVIVENIQTTSPYNPYIYIWSLKKNTLLAQKLMSGSRRWGIPFIGDVDGCGKPEILFICGITNTPATYFIYAFKYEEGNDLLTLFWKLSNTDTSLCTGLTLFDFNQDGIAEIVYRDEKTLRIINGSGTGTDREENSNTIDPVTKILTNYELAEPITCTSGTGYEYPTIADIDGETAILIAGATSGVPANGDLRVFKSGGSPWASARPVWNQYCYNPVYVNDDLTIPQHPLNPATRFVDADGNYLQPFNNFLQQATLLNGEGKMLAYGPNLGFVPNSIQFDQKGTTVGVSFQIQNTGDVDYVGNITISTYIFENSSFRKLATNTLSVEARKGEYPSVSYTVSNFPINNNNISASDVLQIRLNEEDGQFLIPECNYSGNYSQDLFGAPNYAMCGDEEGTLYFYPQNSGYDYYWYDANPKLNPSASYSGPKDSHSFSFKNFPNEGVKHFYVRVYDSGNSDWLNDEVYPVNVFLVPGSLTWTGSAADNDWNNPDNWEYPNKPFLPCIECESYQIPGACTNVEIPNGKSHYPVLTSDVSVPTVYADYSCDRIHFEFGGEIKRTDSLQYQKAFVDVTLNGNQWYLFSSPLHNLYPGDFYVSTPNPYYDEYFIEPMFLEVTNPQTGLRTSEAQWTGSFNNPDIPLDAGRGVAIWVDDRKEPDYGTHKKVTFHFPKSDPFYYYYTDYGLQLNERTPDLARDKMHRFIYESDTFDGTVSWTVDAVKDTMILIGNPFMAHLDFEKFAALNDEKIKNEYKLAYGVTTADGSEGKVREFFTRRKKDDENGYINIEPLSGDDLTSYIAPMQAFVVTPLKTEKMTLKAQISDTEVNPAGSAFRSAQNAAPARTLRINAIRGEHVSQALVLQRENASHSYILTEDSRKLFPGSDKVSVMVYTRSSDGYALDINSFGNFGQDIPVGIRTTEPGEIRLKFSGMESFGERTVIYLHDRQEGRVVNLSKTDEYSFNKSDSELYLENRFFLTFSDAMGIHLPAVNTNIIMEQLPGQTVRIATENGSPLGRIKIVNIQGNILFSQEVAEAAYTFQAPTEGIYIVRVNETVRKLKVKS